MSKQESVLLDVKHLELIQGVISRLANNAFLLKGWTVALVGAFVGFAAKESNYKIALLSYLPVVVFWGLDAYCLRYERLFRSLYKDAALGKVPAHSMDIEGYKRKTQYFSALATPVLAAFYLSIAMLAVGIVYLVGR